ncbi:choloylglycine hydrolase [Paraburkholderia hospita]|uniref:Choloylglycine hydrolase n=1 Tax=Paraburkholderia hospita TaxID=169430 RepID=A0ABN0FCD3_9BURK|nr:linear amide C-N hydrolase [Paraburkholderia hospita]EIM96354.1 choloylglycine hydrolase [Paraburkholderia hospita]OUL83649.1 hypothetical protein CA602_21780 [Paraburkholderia hospita]
MIDLDTFLLPPTSQNYLALRRLRVSGSHADIGRALATIARSDYGVTLAHYRDRIYGTSRLDYFKKNWPAGYERSLGVAAAYGIEPYSGEFDTSALPFDFSGAGCSVVFIPSALSANRKPLVGRNYDWYTVTASELHGRPVRPGEFPCSSRSQVTELRPHGAPATLHISAVDLLNPWIDGMNEEGLLVTVLSDPTAPAAGVPMAGGRAAGVSQFQLPLLLLQQCVCVDEAKRLILQQRIFSPTRGLHFLIADADGRATVFEIDGTTGEYVFVDAVADKPLVVTNHPLHHFPNHADYPELDMSMEHNTYVRVCMLEDAIADHDGAFTPGDVHALLMKVTCAFADNRMAGVNAPFPERTLWSYVADLGEKVFNATFYLGDIGPIVGTNAMRVRRSELMRIAFS